MSPQARTSRIRRLGRLLTKVLLAVLLVILLFIVNGTILAAGETPVWGRTSHAPAAPLKTGEEIVVVTFNIAKAFVHRGGLSFESVDAVRGRVAEIARVVGAEKPDLVFLSEAVFECGPCPVNQVVEIADRAGLAYWAFGENYNFGIPFLRIVGGNAILSRRPLDPVANPPLAGRKPFYATTNSRRVLWCRMPVGDATVLLGAVHNDSFSLANNLRQTRQILDYIAGRPTVLAGDFNAQIHDPSMRAVEASGLFSGELRGVPSFVIRTPPERMDFILAPKSWELIESRVIANDVSDHRPVVSRFRVR